MMTTRMDAVGWEWYHSCWRVSFDDFFRDDMVNDIKIWIRENITGIHGRDFNIGGRAVYFLNETDALLFYTAFK